MRFARHDSLPGRNLGKIELTDLLAYQKAGKMTTVQIQHDLRKTYVTAVEQNHPTNLPALPFDVSNKGAQEYSHTEELMGTYKVDKYLAETERMAPQATAGLRSDFDCVDWNNPEFMYNPVYTEMMIEAEGRFLHDLHRTKAAEMQGWDLDTKAAEVERQLTQRLSADGVTAIREVFGGRSIRQILELLRDKPLKVMGKEVRPQTDEMLEMEARILAANGITVITTEQFTDTTNIYLTSLFCFLFGSDGGTFYTPSHSPVFKLGRKVLQGDGAQFAPELYDGFIRHLKAVRQEVREGRHVGRMAAANHPNILNTLTDDRSALLYARVLAPNQEAVRRINEAAERGFRITLNTLSGSAARGLMAQLSAMGINTEVFNPLWAEEEPYFNVGYAVATNKAGELFVDHFGVDTSAPKVVRQIPYQETLASAPIGHIVYECDPDNDRFMVKQVLSTDAIALCEAFAIDYYPLGNGKILAAPSPNKTFLLLDIANYERMKGSGEWDKATFLDFPTYVSSAAWVEFGEYIVREHGNLAIFLSRVGFKNFNQVLGQIQKWYFEETTDEFTIPSQLGDAFTFNRSEIDQRPFRVFSKKEESGGWTTGFGQPITNLLGTVSLSSPEKSAGDALLAHLTDMAGRFLDGREMDLPKVIESAYTQYGLASKVDIRYDVSHGSEGAISLLKGEAADKAKAQAGAQKKNFNGLFFSIGKAYSEGKIDLPKVVSILKKVLPEWSDTWDCLDSLTYVVEPLVVGSRPEGVMMIFKPKDGKEPMVTRFKFRPSGTDPLKSKVYVDATAVTPDKKEEIGHAFDRIKQQDLYAVLDAFGIEYAEAKPAEAEEIGLTQVQ